MYIKSNVGIVAFFKRSWKTQLRILLILGSVAILYKNFLDVYIDIPGSVIAVLGTALAFFIGFTNSQAYDRWWEARKIWGALVNDSRSWGRMVTSYFHDNPELQTLMIKRHISFLYALTTKLRNLEDHQYESYLVQEDLDRTQGQGHKPNAILGLQGVTIDNQNQMGSIDGFRLNQLNDMLNRFSDSMGKAERIKSTIFPPFYDYLTRLSVWAFLTLFTMGASELVGYWAIVFGYIVGMVYLYTLLSGHALLNPFENTKFDTPISALTRTIEINLLEQLGEKDVPDPVEPVDGEYLM